MFFPLLLQHCVTNIKSSEDGVNLKEIPKLRMGKSVSSLLQIVVKKCKSYFKRKSDESRVNSADGKHKTIESNMDTSAIDHLPDEIIVLILLRCPIKSVVRIKSVSKSWLSIISDPRFTKTDHIQRSKLPENKNKFVVRSTIRNQAGGACINLMRLEDGKFRRESAFQTTLGRELRLLSSCDGLFLVSRGRATVDYALWNPSIGKHIILRPHPNITHTHPWHYDIYHDSLTEDYKIVFIYRQFYTVYSCNNGSWSEMRDLPCHRIQLAYLGDGYFYGDVCNGEIVCFDARDGKLHKLRLPNDVRGGRLELKQVSERVCLVELNQNSRKIQLWVMEKHASFDDDKWCCSWRKLISMEREIPNISFLCDPNALCLSNEDDVVLPVLFPDGCILKRKHVIYNPHDKSFSEIKIDGVLNHEFFPFSENLYMPSSNMF